MHSLKAHIDYETNYSGNNDKHHIHGERSEFTIIRLGLWVSWLQLITVFFHKKTLTVVNCFVVAQWQSLL